MFNEVTISNRKIGLNYPPLVIVEIGINHKGGLGVAFEMMYAATKSDAEIIKCQDPYC
jgi:N-acetylneuraminate synthase